MENVSTQLSILNDFQEQLQQGVVTKGMVKSIEKALGSNFITSNIRIESYTDTPTSINIDKTVEAVKGKLSELEYAEKSLAYTIEDYHNDIVNLISILTNKINNISCFISNTPQTVIEFLMNENNLKYYDDSDNLKNALEVSILELIEQRTPVIDAIIELSIKDTEVSKEDVKDRLEAMVRAYKEETEKLDNALISPVDVVLSRIDMESSILDILKCHRAYNETVLQTYLDTILCNKDIDLKVVTENVKKDLKGLASIEPSSIDLDFIKEFKVTVDKYSSAMELFANIWYTICNITKE